MVMSMPLIVNCTHSLAVGCGNISVREKTLKGTVGSRSSMAVTGDETETGMLAIISSTNRSLKKKEGLFTLLFSLNIH